MGHAKELVTVDVYGDNRQIITERIPEIEEFMKEVLPNEEGISSYKESLHEIVADTSEYIS